MKKTLFPKPLEKGDIVALAAPSGPLEEERVAGAKNALEAFGLRVLMSDEITARDRYLAGSDARRLAELVEALSNPQVKAVFLGRGGYGVQRLLPLIDFSRFTAPKAVIGFSDNTALHAALAAKLGWATLHAPHPRAEKPEELKEVLACLGLFGDPLKPSFTGLKTLRQGAAVKAPVAGGCLSLLSTLVGTPFSFDYAGKIVFIEDIAEPPYRLDRMLRHLLNCGVLSGAKGFVFGKPESFIAEGGSIGDVEALLAEFAAEVGVPVACGLPCGHVEGHRPLPFGPEAIFDAEKGELKFTEPFAR